MRITPKTTYAVRCLVYLKDHYEEHSALNSIAAGTVIPRPFLSKVLQNMVHNGFVISKKGRNGGFKLSRPPEKITIYDISRATSGGRSVLETRCREGRWRCPFYGTCKLRGIFADLGKIVDMHLRSRNLSHL